MVDQNALRTNQIFIVATVAVAFVFGSTWGAWLLAILAIFMAIGVIIPGNGPLQLFYRQVLLPTGLVKAKREPGSMEPHRFAQAMGATVLALAAIFLFGGFDLIGWILGFLVLALALVNLVFGFCAGCFIHLQLGRLREDVAHE